MPDSTLSITSKALFKPHARRLAFAAVILSLALLTGACSEISYYRQSAEGQLDIVKRRQPIDELLADNNRDPQIRERLASVKAIRTFAVEALGLPDTGSYTLYADLERDYAVLSLYAAPEFSVELKSWCYPVIGCANYRGFFDRPMLTEYAEELEQQNFDIYIARVPAYSTLGWFDDPVLNTVLNWSEPQLAGLIFHELAHQKFYVNGDTVFNESFATLVERIGVVRWLEKHNRHQAVKKFRDYWSYRRQVVDLIVSGREELKEIYAQSSEPGDMRTAKHKSLDTLRQRYQALRSGMPFDPGYDGWFAAELNNAKLGAVSVYHGYVDAFGKMLDQRDGDLESFYAEVERIGALPPAQRGEYMLQIQKAD